MSQGQLDQKVREYYVRQELSSEMLQGLKQSIRAGRKARSSWARSSRRTWMVAAAAIVAVGSLTVFLAHFFFQSTRPDDPSMQIAREAAMCHHQNLAVEFDASDYSDLRAKMDRLDFSPVEPARLHGQGMNLVGARYTMLHGRPAVQLVFVGPDGKVCTLYQARSGEDLASLGASEHEVDGLVVDVWKEKGLVMALARPTG